MSALKIVGAILLGALRTLMAVAAWFNAPREARGIDMLELLVLMGISFGCFLGAWHPLS